MKTRSALLSASLALAIIACSSSTEPLRDPSLLTVTTTVDRDSFTPGDTLRMTFTVKNPSGHTVEDPPECSPRWSPRWQIRDSLGNLYLNHSCFSPLFLPSQANLPPDVFAPGEAKEWHDAWTGQRSGRGFSFVTPGRYSVEGSLVVGDEVLDSDTAWVEVLPAHTFALDVQPGVAEVGDTVTAAATLGNHTILSIRLNILSTCNFPILAERNGLPYADLANCQYPVDRYVTLGGGQVLADTIEWLVQEPGEYLLTANLGFPTLDPEIVATANVTVR